VQRVEREKWELQQQRERLHRERESLQRLDQEHEREVRVLSRALGIRPSVAAAAGPELSDLVAEALRRDFLAAEERAEDATYENYLAEDAENANLGMPACLEMPLAEVHTVGQWLSAEVARTRRHEAAVREEAAALRFECQEQASSVSKQRTLHLAAERESKEMEAALTSAHQRAASAVKAGEARRRELEVQVGILRTELQAQSAACAESATQRTARDAECAELAAATEHLSSELEADEAFSIELESVLEAVKKEVDTESHELRAETTEEGRLASEAAESRRREDELAAELAVERERTQEASRVATVLLEQRRLVAEEADEALRCCDGALGDFQASAETAVVPGGQVAPSQQPGDPVQDILGQRLAIVHSQVRAAENAHAHAMLELREERQEHRQLHAQVARDNASRSARVSRPAVSSADSSLTWCR
jgi:hypothetical protein